MKYLLVTVLLALVTLLSVLAATGSQDNTDGYRSSESELQLNAENAYRYDASIANR